MSGKGRSGALFHSRGEAGWSAHGVPRLHVRPGGLAEAGEVVAGLGIRRALVVTDAGVRAAGWAGAVAAAIRAGGGAAAVWDGVRPDPADELVHRCRDELLRHGHDGLVAVGGGSTIDVAKAAAGLVAAGGLLPEYEGLGRLAEPGPPVVAVPTTPCGGAEISRHAVIAAPGGRKYAVSGPHLAPRAVLVDPDTFATAPRDVLLDTVLDSLIHAVEAFLARAATPYTDLFARAAVESITRAAGPALFTAPHRAECDIGGVQRNESHIRCAGAAAAATELVTGCLAAGVAMSEANAGVIHALGYPLTGEYGIPHGRANALVAGAALRVLAAAAPQRCAELAALWHGGGGRPASGAGAGGLAGAFCALLGRLGVTGSLAGHGVPRARLPELAGLACGYQPVLRNSPLDLTESDLAGLYEDAWLAGGARP